MTPLPQISVRDDDISENDTNPKSESINSLHNLHIHWALAFVIACSAVNLVLLTVIVRTDQPSEATQSNTQEPSLRTAYLNFDQLYNDSSFPRKPLDPIVNRGNVFYQASSRDGEQNKVMEVWSDVRVTSLGLMPLLGRRLLVNSTMSTFAQFAVLDYGMERCTVALTIPHQNITNGGAILKSGNSYSTFIDVYHYPALTKRLDFSTLTWDSRPSGTTRKLLTSLPAIYGDTTEGALFECPSLTYQTFEFSCADCQMDVVTKGEVNEGLYIKQYRSL